MIKLYFASFVITKSSNVTSATSSALQANKATPPVVYVESVTDAIC